MKIRLAPPHPHEPGDAGALKELVTSSVMPEDQVEHVHVRAVSGQYDVSIFLSARDLASAQMNGTVLSSRLLRDYLPGWTLRKAWYEPAV
jgi:hypothetical protein